MDWRATDAYRPRDLARLFLLGVVPQVYAFGLILGVTASSYERAFSEFGKSLPPLTAAFLELGRPERLVPICVLAVALSVVACVAPVPRVARASYIRLTGGLATGALVLWGAAVCLPMGCLCRSMDPRPEAWWYEHAWELAATTMVLPSAAWLAMRHSMRTKPFPACECAHVLMFAGAFIVGVTERHGLPEAFLPSAFTALFLPGLPSTLAALAAAGVLVLGWSRCASPHRRFGPYFVLALSFLTSVIVGLKICPRL